MHQNSYFKAAYSIWGKTAGDIMIIEKSCVYPTVLIFKSLIYGTKFYYTVVKFAN